jgi:uncharacterized membrane protein YeiH
VKLLFVIEILGTVAFTFSGVVAATRKKLDVFGILIIAFVTAVGGGTLRDILIGVFPVSWLNNTPLLITIAVTYMGSLFYHQKFSQYKKIFFWMDTLGLALFSIAAINKGVDASLNIPVCIALGTITGCFGGVIRDVLLNEVPYVFREDIYASACIVGGIVYFLVLHFSNNEIYASSIAAAVVVFVRFLAEFKNIRLPDLYK